MSFRVDDHYFSMQTKSIQTAVIIAANERAEDPANQVSTSAKANRIARRICREAFDQFKKGIEAQFPAKEYEDLIFLTLQSRENLFFVELHNQVVKALCP